MSKVVAAMPEKLRNCCQKKHDFTPYLDGQCRSFTQGEDFTIKPVSWAQQLRNAAVKANLRPEYRIRGLQVYFQALPNGNGNGNGNGHH